MPIAYQEYYTLGDYQHWEGDWELIDGMPYAMAPSPGVTHQTVCVNVVSQIKSNTKIKNSNCGVCHVLMETDWLVSNDTVVRPDVMVVCKELDEKVAVTPELIVEVVSLSSTKRDEMMKFSLYQQEGVMYYILIYPEKHVAKIYQNNERGFIKRDDCSVEIIDFMIGDCNFKINFSSIWRE